MSEAPQFTAGNWNPFEIRTPRTNIGIEAGHGGMSKRQQKRALEMMQQHHKNVMEYSAAQYGHETKFQTSLSGLRETEAQGQHSRNLEFYGTTSKGAKPGTAYKTTMPGGYTLDMTTKDRPKRKTTTKSTPAPTAVKPKATATFPPVRLSEEPQQEAPAAAAPAKKSGASVGRDPKTGRAVSLKNNPAAATAKPVSKASNKPTVKRNPKTGRAQSLKKK